MRHLAPLLRPAPRFYAPIVAMALLLAASPSIDAGIHPPGQNHSAPISPDSGDDFVVGRHSIDVPAANAAFAHPAFDHPASAHSAPGHPAFDHPASDHSASDHSVPHNPAGFTALSGRQLQLEGAPSMVILVPETTEAVEGLVFRSRNGDAWSEWIELDSAEHEAPDGLEGEEGHGGPPAGIGPIWIGSDATDIEIASLHGAVGLTVETLEPVVRPEVPLVANALPGQPTIQPRSSWTSRGFVSEHNGCEDGPYLATNIRAAVVHHTVTSNVYNQSDVDDQLRAIYRLHVDINGWCDIAYNFVVDRFGTIWEARTGGVENPVIGGHAKGFNTWTVGIALLGQHQAGASPASAVPTAASVASVQALIGWKLGMHGVDPNGTTWLKNRSSNGVMKFPTQAWVQVPTVLGHRDLGVTSCPGSHTVPKLTDIRAALLDGRVGDPPYSFVAHEPYEHGPGIVVVDAVGGVRPAGSAQQPLAGLVPNGTTAVSVDGGPTGGQVLTSAGMLVSYGDAPTISGAPSGSTVAVDLEVQANGGAGWVLARTGEVHGFGGAPDPTWSSLAPAVAFELDDDGVGYAIDGTGFLSPVGGAPAAALSAPLAAAAVDVAVLPQQAGGWVLSASGGLAAFGSADDFQLDAEVQARAVMAAINGRGGWVLDSEGRLHPFGAERPILPISTTVGVPTAIDGALVDWIADDRSDLMRFTFALTELFLGEPMSPLDADVLASRVVYEGRALVVDELAHSDAWAGQLVDDLYVAVLGRSPEATGRAYWVEQLANGTRTQDLGAFFYGSPEYYADAGSAEAYVIRLYDALLGRAPDPSGLSFWVEQLEAGTAQPTDISTGFYQSPESRLGRVDALYAQILQRSPDEEGRNYWADRLLDIDDIELAIELASSVEYYDLTTETPEEE